MNYVGHLAAGLMACVLCSSFALADSVEDLRGSWSLRQYTEKGVVRDNVGGRVIFSKSDIDLVFWLLNPDGSVQRSALLVGTYEPKGDDLNVLAGFFAKFVEPKLVTEKQKSVSLVSDPPKPDPARFLVEGDRLLLTFPASGNKMSFDRSSR